MAINGIVNVTDLSNGAGNVVVNDTLDVNWGVNVTGNVAASGNVNATQFCNAAGTTCYTLAELYGGGGSGDNLGNHIATQDVNINNHSLNNVPFISNGSGDVVVNDTLNVAWGLGVNGNVGVVNGDISTDQDVNAARFCDAGGSTCYTLSQLYGGGGAPADNLGNHTATDDLNMTGHNILNVNNLSNTAGVVMIDDDVHITGSLTVDNGISGDIDITGNVTANYYCGTGGGTCYTINELYNGGGSGLWSQSGLDVYYDAGNVGIGTAAPEKALHVAGDAVVSAGNGYYARYNNAGDDHTGSLKWNALQLGNNGANYIIAGKTIAGSDLRFIVNNTNEYEHNVTPPDGTTAMIIASDGTVGVGTDAPDQTLDVAGGISAVNYCDDTGTTCYTLSELYGGGSSGDNLGDHLATQDLDMGGFNIGNVGSISGNAETADNLNGAIACADGQIMKRQGSSWICADNVIENRTDDPANPATGQIWLRTDI